MGFQGRNGDIQDHHTPREERKGMAMKPKDLYDKST
jgi:hypothetical protein